MPHDPQSELLPPVSETTYAPAEPANTPARSEWNPRSAPGTYFLLAANTVVFLWMVHAGVSWTSPQPDQLLHFGANSTRLVLEGQWYRMFTAIFVHIGVIHIATNMWCLWNLGLLGEPLLGPFGLVAVYVLTGVAGNLLSNAVNILLAISVHNPSILDVPGAGASGAVFGIAGILIILLSNRRLPIPWPELKRLRTSVIRFAVINLIIGAGTLFAGPVRIDNSAHIGGFVSGLALGPGLLARMTAGRTRYLARQRTVFLAAAFLLALVGYWIESLRPW